MLLPPRSSGAVVAVAAAVAAAALAAMVPWRTGGRVALVLTEGSEKWATENAAKTTTRRESTEGVKTLKLCT